MELIELKEVDLNVVRLKNSEKGLLRRVTTDCVEDEFFSVTRTRDEISIIVQAPVPDYLPQEKIERDWGVVRIAGELDFSLVGVLSKLLVPLAEAGISVFVSSTFNTDYILLKKAKIAEALTMLKEKGVCSVSFEETRIQERRLSTGALRPFSLERYFAKYEFSAPYLLCCSDCESLSLTEVLNLADTECRAIWGNLSLGYTESSGLPLLRKEIASLYNGEGSSLPKVESEDTLVLCPEEGIYITMRVVLKPGDHVIVVSPAYQSLSEIATSMGCVVKDWEAVIDQNGSWSFRVTDLEKLVTARTKLIVVNFPHNPTGALLSHEDWQRVVDIAKQNSCFLFSDEMYRGLEFDKAAQLETASRLYEKAITLSGVSKTLSLPGLRMGWIVSRDKELLAQMRHYRDYTTICPSAPSEILALIALRNHDIILERNHEIIQTSLAEVEAFFGKHRDKFLFARPSGGTMCFPKLLLDVGVEQFCSELVKERGIMLLPSTVYEVSGLTRNFRLGFGRTNVPQILEILSEHLS